MLNRIPLKTWIGCGVVAAFLVMIAVWRVEVAGLRADLNGTQAQLELAQIHLDQCRADNANLTTAIDAQNGAVRAMEEAAAQRQREAEKALAEARKETASAQARAAAILATQPTSDICASADALILGAIK